MYHQYFQSTHTLASQFGAHIIEGSENSVIVETSGSTSRPEAFLSLVKPLEIIIESARTDNTLSKHGVGSGRSQARYQCLPHSMHRAHTSTGSKRGTVQTELWTRASSIFGDADDDPRLKVIKKWFGKTIIKYAFTVFFLCHFSVLLDDNIRLRSAAKLSYSEGKPWVAYL
ncbi:hypothetical protein EW146_g684 [Bondarzewia mesenterica]|uniref:Acetolactate synthase small subunit C-terminal domain-containing protein n=1 Tax=Bondarzewia mesenterica TaxID=1095465 RepID=A0A4S4M6A2_9AGAM|nr:hypothetical protein EW146_g684 [Bondarzewia mesenterica]